METVPKSATNALSNIIGAGKLKNVHDTTKLASQGWEYGERGMWFRDHRCRPSYVIKL